MKVVMTMWAVCLGGLMLAAPSALATDDLNGASPCVEGVNWFFLVVGEDCSPIAGGAPSPSPGEKKSRAGGPPPARPLELPPETIVVTGTKPRDGDSGPPLTARPPRLDGDPELRRSRGVRESASMSPAPPKARYPAWNDRDGWAKARDKMRVCEELYKAIRWYHRDEPTFTRGESGFWRRFRRMIIEITGPIDPADFKSTITRWKEGCDDLFPTTVY